MEAGGGDTWPVWHNTSINPHEPSTRSQPIFGRFSTVSRPISFILRRIHAPERPETPHTNQFSSRPFLVGENIASLVGLGALNQLHVCLHAIADECFRELVRNVGVGVKTGEGDELEEAEKSVTSGIKFWPGCHTGGSATLAAAPHSQSELSELPDKLLHLLGAETGSGPVERGREVVGEPLAGDLGVDTVGELLSLGVDGGLGLHPDQVGVGSKGDGTVDSALSASLVTEVALRVLAVVDRRMRASRDVGP